MPKMKTHKGTLKRVKITGGKRKSKIIKKKCGQNHFNSKESGNKTRSKRRAVSIAKVDEKNYKAMLPYHT